MTQLETGKLYRFIREIFLARATAKEYIKSTLQNQVNFPLVVIDSLTSDSVLNSDKPKDIKWKTSKVDELALVCNIIPITSKLGHDVVVGLLLENEICCLSGKHERLVNFFREAYQK